MTNALNRQKDKYIDSATDYAHVHGRLLNKQHFWCILYSTNTVIRHIRQSNTQYANSVGMGCDRLVGA